jgi:hypothetical protein
MDYFRPRIVAFVFFARNGRMGSFRAEAPHAAVPYVSAISKIRIFLARRQGRAVNEMATDEEWIDSASRDSASARFCYCALGLTIEAPVACPGFFPGTAGEGRPGVVISFGPAPATIADPVVNHALLQVDRHGDALFYIPRVARYWLRGAAEIVVDLCPGAPLSRALGYLRGAPLSLIAQKRGRLPVAAACVAREDRAVLIGGSVGVGKSAMALAFVARGWRLMADEVCALDLADPRQGARVWPGYPEIRVHPDVASRFPQFPAWGPPTPGGRLILPLEGVFEPQPLAPAALIVLDFAMGGAPEALDPLAGARKFKALMNLRCFVDALAAADARRSTAAVAALAARLRVFTFDRRRQSLDRINEKAERLIDALDG